MIPLKEKIQETIRAHKKEVANNLRDRAVHIGNLKNISPGDKIDVHNGCSYHTSLYCEVNMIDKRGEAIYIHLHGKIMRFHMFNCREWELSAKKPTEEGTTKEENRQLSGGGFINIIRYPIINVKYKEKLPVPISFLCYDEKELCACPYLTKNDETYWCTYLRDFLFENSSWGLNAKACKRRITKKVT